MFVGDHSQATPTIITYIYTLCLSHSRLRVNEHKSPNRESSEEDILETQPNGERKDVPPNL